MIKWILHIAIIVFAWNVSAQTSDSKEKVWEKEEKRLEYKRQKSFKGPKDWDGGYPSSMGSEYVYVPPSGSRINPRRGLTQEEQNGSGGTLPQDPEIERLNPTELPDIDLPDVDLPDVDLPDVDLPDIDPPSISASFWKTLLFILLGAIIIFALYMIFRNRIRSDQKIAPQVNVENDWNPEEITKTELELKLEKAEAEKDYRSCVRIYFTFILKSLIKRRWIQWKKEKTNHHYVLEMQKQASRSEFEKCVHIYELVWYGKYQIDEKIYRTVLPTLRNYYESVKVSDDK